jgi:hypothetical protein
MLVIYNHIDSNGSNRYNNNNNNDSPNELMSLTTHSNSQSPVLSYI